MGLLFWLLIIVLVLFLILDYVVNRSFLTPGVIFNTLFLIVLLLYSLQLSDIQDTLSTRTVACFWATIIPFNIVVFLYYFFSNKKKVEVIGNYDKQKDRYCLSHNATMALRFILIILFFIQVAYSRGLPLLWKLTGDPRTYVDFGIPSLTGAFYGLLILFGAYSLTQKGVDKYLCFAMGIMIISRQILISMVVEGILFFILLRKRRIRYLPLKLLVIAIIGIAGFSLIGNFRTGNDEFLAVAQFKEGTEWIPAGIKWVYAYLTFSISNFNNLVDMTPGGMNHGASLFNALLPTVLTNTLSITEKESFYHLKVINFNVSTFYPEIYLDFGVPGIAFFSFFMGVIGIAIYSRVVNNKNVRNVALYAIFIHNILLLTFINMFVYLPVAIQFLYVFFIFRKKRHYSQTSTAKENNNKNEVTVVC